MAGKMNERALTVQTLDMVFEIYKSSVCIEKINGFLNNIFLQTLLLKPHSHCADVATVHPDAGQPVYRDAPGHIS